MKFEWASSLLRLFLRVGVEGVMIACLVSVPAPPGAIQGSQGSKRYQACKTPLKSETRQMSRKKAALRPFSRLSAGRSLGGRRAMLALISAVDLDVADGKSE